MQGVTNSGLALDVSPKVKSLLVRTGSLLLLPTRPLPLLPQSVSVLFLPSRLTRRMAQCPHSTFPLTLDRVFRSGLIRTEQLLNTKRTVPNVKPTEQTTTNNNNSNNNRPHITSLPLLPLLLHLPFPRHLLHKATLILLKSPWQPVLPRPHHNTHTRLRHTFCPNRQTEAKKESTP